MMKNIISPLFQIWTFFLALIVAFSCVGYSPLPSIAYPAALFLSCFIVIIVLVSYSKKVFFSFSMVAILLVSFLSIIIGQPDIRFKSYQRLVYFVALSFVVSPLFRTNKLDYQRHLLLQYLLYFCLFLSAGSFVCYFLGINLMQIGEDVLYYEDFSIGGTFGGLVKHSMLLGPLCVVSVLFLLTTQNKLLSVGWIRYTLILASFGGLLMSASRGAIYGGIIAVVFAIFKKSKNKIQFVKWIAIIGVLLLATYPLWSLLLNGVIYKNEYRADAGNGFFASRIFLYRHRFDEFLHNPLTGIGFSSAKSFDYYEVHKTGTVEYGNSWLCLFSTIGLLGAIPAIFLFIQRFFETSKAASTNNDALFASSTLLFFFIHFMIEGYVLSAGNPLCFLFWLVLSNTYGNDSIIVNTGE